MEVKYKLVPVEPTPASHFCNKCGYLGSTEAHADCNYHALQVSSEKPEVLVPEWFKEEYATLKKTSERLAPLDRPADKPEVAVPVFSESDLIEIASSYSAYAGSDTDLYLNAWINSGEAKGFIDLINDRSAPSHSQQSAPSNWISEEASKAVESTKDWPQWRKDAITSRTDDRCPSHESEQ